MLMQELGPLLTPPDNKPLEHTGLQRFRHYFDALAHVLPACQSEKPASAAACIDKPAADCFDWTRLTVPAANVLMLIARLTQQLSATACCEVSAFFVTALSCIHIDWSLLALLSATAPHQLRYPMLLSQLNCVLRPAYSMIHIRHPTPGCNVVSVMIGC